MNATALLIVDQVEPSRRFFCDRLGFEVTIEVPHQGRTGFCLLARGAAELMLQSTASLTEDLSPLRDERFHAVVYLDVPDVAGLSADAAGLEVVHPLRRTNYGADELWIREPGGNVVGLSSPARVDSPGDP